MTQALKCPFHPFTEIPRDCHACYDYDGVMRECRKMRRKETSS